MKVVTMVEANISEQNLEKLVSDFESATKSRPPDGLLQSFLLQDTNEPMLWRIITVWESMEKLIAMRESGETPVAIKIFHDAGAKPNLKILESKVDFTV